MHIVPVNKVESAGKDPGLYPPRPRPTAETYRTMYAEIVARREQEGETFEMPSDEELEKFAVEQQPYWDETIGRLYEMGKGYWLTMRHQGRVYVMLGSKNNVAEPMIAANTATVEDMPGGSEPDLAESDSPDQPLSPVSVRVDPMVVLEMGRSSDVKVHLDMQDGWYIYAATGRNVGQGMKETSVSFSVPDGLETVGAVKRPPFRFKGSYDVHMGKAVTWGQSVEAMDGTLPGLYEVSAEVTYQTCKDDLCLLPQTETVTARVLVQ